MLATSLSEIGPLGWTVAALVAFGGAGLFTHYAFKLVNRWCPPDPDGESAGPSEGFVDEVLRQRDVRQARYREERLRSRRPFDQERM